MRGALHGVGLRALALGARLGLLVGVLPRLAAGEVADYLLLTTAAALLGRLLALGLEDELPLVVRGEPARARRLARLALGPLALACALGGAALAALALAPGGRLAPALAVAAGALAITSALVVGGLVRTLSPALFERLGAAPPPLVLAAAWGLPGLDAARLVLLGAAAQAVVAAAGAAAAGLLARAAPDPARADLAARPRLRRGAAKLASGLLLVAQVRGAGWVPALLGRDPGDALSLAVLVAEAGLQLGHAVAQRHYAEYATGAGSPGLAARRGLALWGALAAAAGLAALAATALGHGGVGGAQAWLGAAIPGLDLAAVAWALLHAGALLALLEARYLGWSRAAPAAPLLALQGAWLLALGAVVVALPPARWLPGAALVGAALAGCALLALGTVAHAPGAAVGGGGR